LLQQCHNYIYITYLRQQCHNYIYRPFATTVSQLKICDLLVESFEGF